MDKKIREHNVFIEQNIDISSRSGEIDQISKYHNTMLENFQWERFIHLIVTLFFSILTIILIGVYVLTKIEILLIPTVLSLALLVPYIFHYYKLENGVQQMYQLNKKILEKKRELINAP